MNLNNLRVFYDGEIFLLQKYGGISRYFSELIKVYRNTGIIKPKTPPLICDNIHFGETSLLHSWLSSNFSGNLTRFRMVRALNWVSMNQLLKRGKFDVYHMTNYNTVFANNTPKPFVVTIHDMVPEIYPEFFDQPEQIHPNKIQLCHQAAAVIAISKNTKKDLVRIGGVDERKIFVVYHAVSPMFYANTLRRLEVSLPDRYVLFVGNRDCYKNFGRAVEAVAKRMRRDKKLYLICAGGGPLNANERQLLDETHVKDRTMIFPYVIDAELSHLYGHAQCLLFPSIYEGFGLPILEAFQCECPVILSGSSCFPEIARDAAIYFDPMDANSIAQALDQVLESPEMQYALIKLGNHQLNRFSWTKTANETKNVYEYAATRE